MDRAYENEVVKVMSAVMVFRAAEDWMDFGQSQCPRDRAISN
jgi:hypothetical protein